MFIFILNYTCALSVGVCVITVKPTMSQWQAVKDTLNILLCPKKGTYVNIINPL